MASEYVLSRRGLFRLGGTAAAGLALARWAPILAQEMHGPVSPDEALLQLIAGNHRWATGQATRPHQDNSRRLEATQGQHPIAVVFSCVDSRVPPEIVFDQGLGDLLVIRTAGHVIDNAALGSIEFGVEELHIPLVVVLGHERCGAVNATIEAIEANATAHGQIGTLIEGIRPAVEQTHGHSGDALDNAVRANTVLTVDALRTRSSLLREALSHGEVKIVGGRYDLQSGLVEITVP